MNLACVLVIYARSGVIHNMYTQACCDTSLYHIQAVGSIDGPGVSYIQYHSDAAASADLVVAPITCAGAVVMSMPSDSRAY